MKKISVNSLIKIALIAAVYVVVTLGFAPISYGPIQFRLSEVLVLLAFIDPLYIPGLVLGCAIANINSPFWIVDVVFGSFATFLSVYAIYLTSKRMGVNKRSLAIASIWPTLFNGVIIGSVLSYLSDIPLLATIASVAIGEFAVVSVLGLIIFNVIIRNKRMIEMLKLGD